MRRQGWGKAFSFSSLQQQRDGTLFPDDVLEGGEEPLVVVVGQLPHCLESGYAFHVDRDGLEHGYSPAWLALPE